MKSTKSNYTIKRETHRIDATGKPVGRLATEVALLLRGKHKVDFTPQVDNGDFVIVDNAHAVTFTGKKFEQKKYYSHSQYPGGLTTKKAYELHAENPSKIIEKAVYAMLPVNRTRATIFKRLTVNN